ncbi:DNA polymerase III subunit beta [Streptomonospora halophila]|uniref:DNA polymerase III subunit beta n=1 Tax=Streptomonospora halophila TaxID=427369 RepID=A0ABP9GAT3_9ACTN
MTTIAETTPATTAIPATPAAVLIANRAELVSALATVGIAISQRPAVPVLAGVLLESDGADVVVRGYDYDTAVSVRLTGAAVAPGRLLVNHAELTKLLKALVKGLGKREADRASVTLRADDGATATVEIAGTTVPLNLLPLEDYPTLPDTPPLVARVACTELTAECRRVLRACGHDDTLPMLTGVKIDPGADGLTLAATDRYRIAVAHVGAEVDRERFPAAGILVPGRELGKTLPQFAGDQVELGYVAHGDIELVSLAAGAVTVVQRALPADFPAYDRFLPRSAAATVVVDRAALLRQITRAAAVLEAKGDRANPVTLTLTDHAVTAAPHLAENSDRVRTPALSADVDGITDPVCVGLTSRYVIDALESFTGQMVTLHITKATKPVLLTDTPEGIGDPTAYRHLLMPIRLS